MPTPISLPKSILNTAASWRLQRETEPLVQEFATPDPTDEQPASSVPDVTPWIDEMLGRASTAVQPVAQAAAGAVQDWVPSVPDAASLIPEAWRPKPAPVSPTSATTPPSGVAVAQRPTAASGSPVAMPTSAPVVDALGVGAAPAVGAPTPAAAPLGRPEEVPSSQPAGSSQYSAGSWTPNQITAATGEGLDYETALAVCGPAAAIAFARKTGRNPTMQEAVGLAKQVGWTAAQGMAGPASQQRLLQSMGVAARLTDGPPDWSAVAADVQRGNPVIISTPGHYFVAERYDPDTGAFDFGNSAAVLKASGGKRWFRPEEIAGLGMGSPRASLFMDSPESPSPSVVAGRTAPNAGATPSAPAAPAAAAPAPSPAAGAPPDQTMYRAPLGQPADDPGQDTAGAYPETMEGRRFYPTRNYEPLGPALRGRTFDAAPYERPGARNRAVPGEIVEWTESVDEGEGQYPSGVQRNAAVISTDPLIEQTQREIDEARYQEWANSLYEGHPRRPGQGYEGRSLPGTVNPDEYPWTSRGQERAPDTEGVVDQGLSYRAPLGQPSDDPGMETGAAAEPALPSWLANDPRDADQGPRETGYSSGGAEGDTPKPGSLPVSGGAPSAPYQSSPDGSVAVPPGWQPPAEQPYQYAGEVRTPRQSWPAQADGQVAVPDGFQPPAEQPYAYAREVAAPLAEDDPGERQTARAPAVTARQKPVWDASGQVVGYRQDDEPPPSDPTVSDPNYTEQQMPPRVYGPAAPAARPTPGTGAAKAGSVARMGAWAWENVIAPAVAALDAANEWVINSPIGNINLQAAGRELGGWDQISQEVGEDTQRLQALLARRDAGDETVDAEIAALTASLNQRMETGRPMRERLLAAGERNPNKGAEIMGGLAQAAATTALAPSAGAGVVRNVAAAALDPISQGIGLGVEAIGPAVRAAGRGARALGEGLEANAGRVAAADARMAAQGSTSTLGTLGVSPGGAPRRVQTVYDVVLPDGTVAVTYQTEDAALAAIRTAGSDAAVRPREIPLPERPPSEAAMRSDYGTRLEETPAAVRGDESLERVRGARGQTPYDNGQVPPNFDQQPLIRDTSDPSNSINLNATPGVSPGLGTRLAADVGSSLGSGTMGAAVGAGMPADSDEERRQNALTGAAIGMVGGPVASRLMRRGGGALATPGVSPGGGPRRFATPADALAAAEKAIGRPNPQGPTTGMSRLEGLRRWIVRQATDNRVDLAELQREAQQRLGRPLEVDEMVTELSRANPSGAAKVMIDDTIRPALQAAGDEYNNLRTLMRLMNNGDVAAATGNPGRLFPGGLTGADSQAAAQHLWSTLSPEQQKILDQSSDALYRVVDHYRDEMVRAGVWTPELAASLKQQYPHWVPTKILDYMSDPATVSTGSRSISLRDRGLRAYTFEGTAKDAEDPIASLVRYVQDAESIVRKNETFNAFVNLRDRVPGWDKLIREVPSNTTPARSRGEKTVTGFVNGERKTFVVPAPLAAAIQMEQGQQVPVLRELTQLFKEFITRTPLFVAGQIPLDAFAYTVRTSAREGGPLAAPKVAAELARGYAEAFRGLLDGSFKGDAARYLREGGGMAGFYDRAADAAGKTVDDLTRRSMFEVRNPADARKLATWIMTGGWVQAVGSRVELAPRVAAFRLGERRALKAGASAEKAALTGVMEGRTVTLDFQQGGAAAKIVNQIVPFFNVGVQSAVTLPRMIREHPTGAVTTLLSLVAAPTIAAEAWNRADPQRSSDYDDVPDYVKDRGIVIMLPGVEGRDERQDRRPNYALIPLREMAPVAIMARDLTQKVIGQGRRDWTDSAKAMLSAASPVQASSGADLFSSVNPVGLNTGLQYYADRDFFRGGNIATDRRDEQASTLAEGVAGVTGARPSQADFAIRDLFGGTGAMASAASNLASGKSKDEDRIQNTPVVGGLLSRFVGDAVGGNLIRAQDTRLPKEVQAVLREAGMPDDAVLPVPSRYQGATLTREEQARWQEATNSLIDRYVERAQRDPKWRSQATREQAVRDALSKARDDAAQRARLPSEAELKRRARDEQRRKAG